MARSCIGMLQILRKTPVFVVTKYFDAISLWAHPHFVYLPLVYRLRLQYCSQWVSDGTDRENYQIGSISFLKVAFLIIKILLEQIYLHSKNNFERNNAINN